MKTKKYVIGALLLFWAFITAVLLAGFTNIQNENPLTGNIVLAAESNNSLQGILLSAEEVAKHNFESNCWTIFENKVYDITSYIPYHPGGKVSILPACGVDSTSAFLASGHSNSAKSLLAAYLLGELNTRISTENQTQNTLNTTNQNNSINQNNSSGTENNTIIEEEEDLVFTIQEVAEHDKSSDCWQIINNKVYDITSYIPYHPGGSSITAYCGKDATSIFSSTGHSSRATALLAQYFIGNLKTQLPEDTNTNQNSTIPTNNTQLNNTIPNNTTIPENNTNQNSTIPENNTNIDFPLYSYTAEIIAKHNSASSCWSHIDNKVYDLTSYITRNSKGPSYILSICGKNGTELFKAVYSPADLDSLSTYLIGNLVSVMPDSQNTQNLPDSQNQENEEDD